MAGSRDGADLEVYEYKTINLASCRIRIKKRKDNEYSFLQLVFDQ